MKRLALLLMAASGFAGLGYQIVWTQQFGLVLGHESAAVLAVVAAFLVNGKKARFAQCAARGTKQMLVVGTGGQIGGNGVEQRVPHVYPPLLGDVVESKARPEYANGLLTSIQAIPDPPQDAALSSAVDETIPGLSERKREVREPSQAPSEQPQEPSEEPRLDLEPDDDDLL